MVRGIAVPNHSRIHEGDSSMELFICSYCCSERKNKNSWLNHERTCPSNPNRNYKNGMTGKKAWNNGLTQQTDSRVKSISPEVINKIINTKQENGTLKHKPETKIKLSIARIKYLNENPDKVPYKLNHYSKKRSYPEEYWKSILDANNISYEEQHQVGLYSLDFAIIHSKVDLEIDGDQHYLDKRIVESDKRRNAKLTDLGWKVVRIKWSDYKKLLTHDQKQEYIKFIINEISGPVGELVNPAAF